MSSDSPQSRGRGPSSAPPVEVRGIPGSAGFAIGPAIIMGARRAGLVLRRIPKHLADDEVARYDAAVAAASAELREVAERLGGDARRAEASILEAYVSMVADPGLRDDVERRVRIDRQCTEWAVDSATREMSRQLEGSPDAYLAERSHDIEFVADCILRALSGRRPSLSIPDGDEPGVLVARDLSPAETVGLDRHRVLALVTERGTRSSHTAILARALEIPAVVGAGEVLGRIAHGDRLVVDGLHGRVTINPSQAALEEADRRARRYREIAEGLRQLKDRPATTRCGTRIVLRANIELEDEAAIALEQGAEGIGLYRTEFLYLNRATQPGEEEQYQTYRRVVEALAPMPVTMRTFDIGGDKLSFALPIPPGHNPALGFRAVRLGLELPELMATQLRAMVRASAHGNMQIMVPMVASLTELFRVRELLDRAVAEVDAKGQPRADRIELGTMIEVPSAAVLADHFAAHSDFMSIGTNDLVQYTLAVDRTSRELARLASDLDPAVLKLVSAVVRAGNSKGRPVLVCGAMASDPLCAVVLVGMGLRELSLEASALPEVKEALSRVTLEEAEEVSELALCAQTADEVETLVAERFAPRLADLLEPED